MNLDLKNFHKIECADNYTVLEHPNGHKIKVAHKGLSTESMKNLEDVPMHLAKGGYSKFAQKYDPNMGSKESKPSKSSSTMPGNQAAASKAFTEPDDMGTNIPKQMLKDGMAEKQYPDVVLNSLNKKAPPYGALGPDEGQHYPPCINPSCKSFGKSHPNCRCYGGNPEGKESHLFAEGGSVEKEYYCDATRAHRKGCEYFKDGGDVKSDSDKLEEAKQDVNAGLQDQTSMPQEQNASPAPTPLPPPVNPNAEISTQPETTSEPDPASQVDQAVSTQPVSAQVQRQPQSQDPTSRVIDDKNRIMNEIYPEAQAFDADLSNGHITPETYSSLFHDKSTLGKIGTLFGLLVGGAGSGLAHQPNMIMDMMNKQIENDLHAQQNSVLNKQNFLKINQQNILNKAQANLTQSEANTKAYALARTQMNYAAFHKLVTDTQKLPPGPQRQQAEQTLAMMKQGIDNENFNIADRAASASALGNMISGTQSTGPNTTMMKSGLLGPEAKEVGEDTEQKTIPGIPGRAQRPIPQQTRDQVQNMNVLDAKAKDLIDYAKKHEGTWNPQTRAVAQQKANEMVGFYSSSLGTSMTEGTRTWLDDQIAKKNPTSVISQELMGSNSRLREIQNSNNMRRNTLLGSVGLKGPQDQKQQPQGNASKAGHAIEYRNGKAYYK